MQIPWQSQSYPFQPWRPELGRVFSTPFSFDCETTLIDDEHDWITPAYVIGAAFDGHRGYFVPRQRVCEFLAVHDGPLVLFHNAAFDLDVLDIVSRPTVDVYQLVDAHHVVDTMLLHQLLTLATEGHPSVGVGEATLETCALRYLGVELPKDLTDADGADVRRAYSKWLNRPLNEIYPIYLEYLARDVIATFHVFGVVCNLMQTTLNTATDSFGYMSPAWLQNCISRWGPQSHQIQLQASIALRAVTRAGLHIDTAQSQQLATELRAIADDLKVELRAFGYVPEVKGNERALKDILDRTLRRHDISDWPETPSGDLSTKAEFLETLAVFEPFFERLVRFREVTKLAKTFVGKMGRRVIHPSFRTLVRSGRTSSHGELNAQNLPRDPRVRTCFVPSAGHVFICADYKAIEMVTLAQAVAHQFGISSRLAEVLNRGEDPHRLVAAQVLDKPVDQVTKDERQKAKAINFGKPGGMGPATLQSYARANYGVDLTAEETQALSDNWFRTFPEMVQFLESDLDVNDKLAQLFGLTWAGQDQHVYGDSRVQYGGPPLPAAILGAMLSKVLSDESPHTQVGVPYSAERLDYFWQAVTERIMLLPPKFHEAVRRRQPSWKLKCAVRNLVDRRGVFTFTGRLRGQARYTVRRNSIFQGLASDGAKLALWRLFRAGYRVVNFVHDECLVEVPADSDITSHALRISELMIEAMREVTPNILVDVEYAATERWHKGAVAERDEHGKLLVWRPATNDGVS